MLDWRRVRKLVAAMDADVAGFWNAGAEEEVVVGMDDWGRPYVRGGSLNEGATIGSGTSSAGAVRERTFASMMGRVAPVRERVRSRTIPTGTMPGIATAPRERACAGPSSTVGWAAGVLRRGPEAFEPSALAREGFEGVEVKGAPVKEDAGEVEYVGRDGVTVEEGT